MCPNAVGGLCVARLCKVLMGDLLAALEFLHKLGVSHNDIKPKNLIVGPDGVTMLVDFGSATMPGLAGAADKKELHDPRRIIGFALLPVKSH